MNKRMIKKHASIIKAFINQESISFTKYQSNVILRNMHIAKPTKYFAN